MISAIVAFVAFAAFAGGTAQKRGDLGATGSPARRRVRGSRLPFGEKAVPQSLGATTGLKSVSLEAV